MAGQLARVDGGPSEPLGVPGNLAAERDDCDRLDQRHKGYNNYGWDGHVGVAKVVEGELLELKVALLDYVGSMGRKLRRSIPLVALLVRCRLLAMVHCRTVPAGKCIARHDGRKRKAGS